jgi:hypothetical protein
VKRRPARKSEHQFATSQFATSIRKHAKSQKNDNQPDGIEFTFLYNILAPYFIYRPKYKSKDESKGVDFKNYNTIRCTKAKGGCVQQKSTALVMYVEVWEVCKGSTNGVGGTACAKPRP